MNKCLFKKYERTVNNSELLKPGELRIEVVVDASFSFEISTQTGSQTLKIINGGTFVSGGSGSEATIGTGYTTLKATVGSIISIPNKYDIKSLKFKGATLYSRNIASLDYMINLRSFEHDNGNLLDANDKIGGSLNGVNLGVELRTFVITNHTLTGSIANFAVQSHLENLIISNTGISGDISTLNELASLKLFKFANCDVYGDLAKAPVNVQTLEGANSGARFTWDSTRAASSSIPNSIGMGITMLNSSTVDAMLINLASCTAIASPGNIIISPSKTSGTEVASAVATLTSKGYNVIA